MERIEAGLLVPGRGDPVRDGCVVLDGATIVYAGPLAGAPETPDAAVTRVATVMPGMWDCHAHLLGLDTPDVTGILTTPPAVAAARCVPDLERALLAGFTSVREVGGYGVQLARVVDEGRVLGPHVYGAGWALSQTGGHGDVHAYPVEVVHGVTRAICDGVPECLKAVRNQLRMGARVIKICASGGVMSELDHPIHQQFSVDELTAIVEEAARAERVVAAHCHGKPGIMAALRAGVATIEHGTFLDDEAAELMVATGATLVPTRFIVDQLLRLEGQVPAYAFRKLVAISEQHAQAMKLALRAGVRIALGTDGFLSVHWGQQAAELGHLVDAGMTPLEAIEAATANGPLTLGSQAPLSGQLADGYDADVIALQADPTADVSVLTDPANVTHVWKSGQLVKQPPAAA